MLSERHTGTPTRPATNATRALPNRLRETRERLEKSTADVANAYNITPQALQKYETGDLQLKVRDLERLAGVLGVPASELLSSTKVRQDEEVRQLLEIAHRFSDADRRRLLKIARVIAEESETEIGPKPGRSA